MSAFQVSPKHIDYLISAAVLYGCQGTKDFEEIALMLEAENLRSLAHRYPGDTSYSGASERNVRLVYTVDPVQVLKAINCYEYQSCEGFEAWERSEARKWCEDLKSVTINRLPGYNQAAWEIS